MHENLDPRPSLKSYVNSGREIPGLRFLDPLPPFGLTGPCSGPSTLINVVGKRNLNGFRWLPFYTFPDALIHHGRQKTKSAGFSNSSDQGLSRYLETGCPNRDFIDFCVSKVWYKIHTNMTRKQSFKCSRSSMIFLHSPSNAVTKYLLLLSVTPFFTWTSLKHIGSPLIWASYLCNNHTQYA